MSMVDAPSTVQLFANLALQLLILAVVIAFIVATIWSVIKSFSKDKNKAGKARRVFGRLFIFALMFTAIGFNHDGIILEENKSCFLDVNSRACEVDAPGFLTMLRPWHDSISHQWGINSVERAQIINAKDRQIFIVDGVLVLFGGLLIARRHRKNPNVA